jgi:hypothetical protein
MAGTLVEDDRGQIVSSVETDATGATAYSAYTIAVSTQALATNNALRITTLEGRADQFDIDLTAIEAVANQALAQSSGGTKLELAGGTMTGYISLHADPSSSMHAVNKGYVDTAIGTSLAQYYTISQTYSRSEMDTRYAQKSGATMTGPLTLASNPSASLQAATKQYVDNIALPAGVIVMWSGVAATIPSGWSLCDGSNGTPDLRDRFIVGAGSTYSPGNTGGTTSHSHTITVASTTLTVAQIPAHNHAVTDPGHAHSVYDPGHAHSYTGLVTNQPHPTGSASFEARGSAAGYTTGASGTGIAIYGAATGISIQNTGSSQGHTHTASENTVDHRPPYYALCFIMKL